MTPRHLVPLALALAVAIAMPTSASAQSEPAPPPTEPPFQEEIAVTEVLLDALVTDREGNVVIGLSHNRWDGGRSAVYRPTFRSISLSPTSPATG